MTSIHKAKGSSLSNMLDNAGQRSLLRKKQRDRKDTVSISKVLMKQYITSPTHSQGLGEALAHTSSFSPADVGDIIHREHILIFCYLLKCSRRRRGTE